ncbi:MAG TPA: hypothetical protein VIY08_00220 [Candidatus Nitrosocosmicus sp.]
MADIQFQQTALHGILKHVSFCNQIIIFILHLRKALLKELCNITDITERFKDYFPCRRKKCTLKHKLN